jgi:CheY-like chemotaxis protein
MTLTGIFLTMSLQFFMVSMWLELVIIGGVICSLLLFFWIRINRLRHEKMELRRLLIEKTELLSYAESRERRILEKVDEIERTKKKLLSRINHEIRTPMNSIMGMVSLLADTPLSTEQGDYNQTIRNCGESLLTVINDILLSDVLAHSKVDSALDVEQKEFDLSNAIEEVFDVFASQAALADIELVYQIDHRIPQYVTGDNNRLRQVLMNLVENSIKFTKQGEILVKVSIKDQKSGSMELTFEVKDTGAGISADDLKFLQNTINEPSVQRSGVGLFLCNRLVGVMGGELSLYSRVNEGTTVEFDIAVGINANPERSELNMGMVAGKRVLLVEDNPTLRNAIHQELLHWKLIPILAESGVQALEILEERPNIDLVLAEMQMPRMDGMKLSKFIRELYPALPIILISTANNEAAKQHAELLSSVVNKPVRYDILGQHILSGLIHKDDLAAEQVRQKMSIDFAAKFPLRILIAEDNLLNQKMAVKVLNKLGYKPDTALNGKEVLEEVSKVNYDLVLMDVQMPEMDGLEATRMIRLCLSAQPIIIAMTANAMQGDREECINAGMDDYISKPVNIEELVIKLEKCALQVKAKQ